MKDFHFIKRSVAALRYHSRDAGIPLVFYLGMLAFFIPRQGVSTTGSILFFCYALFIFVVVWGYTSAVSRQHGEENNPSKARWFWVVLIVAGIFFTTTRLIMFVRYGEAPLGYDTGFYLSAIDSIFNGGIFGHRSVRTLLWTPLVWIGVPRSLILHGLYVLIQFLMAGALFMLAREYAPVNKRIPYAASALFLYAVSLPQFFAFWWMFYQTALAVAFLLLSIAFLYRRSWWALVAAGFGFALHPPTLAPFVIAFAVFAVIRSIYTLVRRQIIEKEVLLIITLGVVVYVCMQLFGIEYFLPYLRDPILKYGWLTTQYPPEIIPQFTGFYIDFSTFRLADLYLFPLAITGVLLYLFRRTPDVGGQRSPRFLLLVVALIVLSILAYFPFIYQHRYLMYLDIVLILLAAYPLMYLISHFVRERMGKIVIATLLGGFLLFSGSVVWSQPPQVFPEELAELKALNRIGKEAFVMTVDASYVPWLQAFTSLDTVGPGFFSNRWSDAAWKEFRDGKSNARRYELLAYYYEKPMYIFVGHWTDAERPYVEFLKNDKHVQRVSPHVWRYDPRTVTRGDVDSTRAREATAEQQAVEGQKL